MLQQETIDIIKSTVPVLEENGEKITKRFYELMFGNHPELLNIFNHANQKQGRQQKALASAIYAAAKHIDQLEAIIPTVVQIGHKHRSLGIKPEHYPIVGKHLLLAIKDVLGEGASDEVILAWEEAYGVIADAFIGIEKNLYIEAESQDGGWKDFRPFTVSKKVKESDVITSFYLKPVDGGKIASFLPGQYISIKVKDGNDSFTHIRQYSLSDAPNGEYYRISVKRERYNSEKPDGRVSNFLHDMIQEGDHIEISAPAGEFVYVPDENPIVFISGGVGITPMMSMLKKAVQSDVSDITFIHATMNGNVHSFHKEVTDVVNENTNVNYYIAYEQPTNEDIQQKQFSVDGRLTIKTLEQWIPSKDSIIYTCGPVPFMQAVYKMLRELGIETDQIHYEFFGPALELN
ncbi:NO-inducible flavohemoprotein [Fredinandcohnia quinoae]|uniref:Flavohemoprotein n=1 Tax=Fredinandcohnia quinoae TaxID=2918902 RepID=A0AAW5E226_9BACI|nr:NO-inducible flavohemoprotein [Fredinandcohnia sp. SECRCQ15]